jgi:hypothetical protein
MARQKAVVDDSISRDLLSAFHTIRHTHGDQDAPMFDIRHIVDQINTRTFSLSKLAHSHGIVMPRLNQ